MLTFRAADKRDLGVLSAADIGAALADQRLEVPPDLEQICQRVDVDADGNVNLIEFVAATMDPRVFCEPSLCRAAFRVLEANHDMSLVVGCRTERRINECAIRAHAVHALATASLHSSHCGACTVCDAGASTRRGDSSSAS